MARVRRTEGAGLGGRRDHGRRDAPGPGVDGGRRGQSQRLDGRQLLHLQRAAGNRAVLSLLSSRRSTPAGSPVVQRAVGFELEAPSWDSWTSKLDATPTEARRMAETMGKQLKKAAPSRTFPKRYVTPLWKAAKIYIDPNGRFELQADESAGGTNVEFVTKAFDETAADQVTQAVHDIAGICERMAARSGRSAAAGKFVWMDELFPGRSGRGALLAGGDSPVKLKPQTTAGVRLDALADFMESIGSRLQPGTPGSTEAAMFQAVRAKTGAADEAGPLTARRQEGRGALQTQGFAGIYLGMAPALARKAVDDFLVKYQARAWAAQLGAHRHRIEGVLSMVIAYLSAAGDLDMLAYPKAATPLMARTDFATMFNALPSIWKVPLKKYEGVRWVNLAVEALAEPSLRDPDAPVFKYRMFGGQERLSALTRRVWLEQMTKGTDLLTARAYQAFLEAGGTPTAAAKSEGEWLESLGKLGGKKEQVGPGRSAPIFELRGMQSTDHTRVEDLVLKTFTYIRRVNKLKDRYYGE